MPHKILRWLLLTLVLRHGAALRGIQFGIR
jgi:hypothetical protein